jgi:hypothetical protein
MLRVLELLIKPFTGSSKFRPNKGAGLMEGVIALGVIGVGIAANVNIFSTSSVSARATFSALSLSHLKTNIAQKLHSKTIVSDSMKGKLADCMTATDANNETCKSGTNVVQPLKEPGETFNFIGSGTSPAYYKLSGELVKEKKKAAYQVKATSMKPICHEEGGSCDLAAEIVISYQITPVTSNYKILGAPNESYFYKSGKVKAGNLKPAYLDEDEAILIVSSFKVSKELTTTDCNPGGYKRTLKSGHKVFRDARPNVLQGFKNISEDGKKADAVCSDAIAAAKKGGDGKDGSRGISGNQGPNGPRGPRGDRGPQGYRGAKPGNYGGSYYPNTGSSSVYIPRDNNI